MDTYFLNAERERETERGRARTQREVLPDLPEDAVRGTYRQRHTKGNFCAGCPRGVGKAPHPVTARSPKQLHTERTRGAMPCGHGTPGSSGPRSPESTATRAGAWAGLPGAGLEETPQRPTSPGQGSLAVCKNAIACGDTRRAQARGPAPAGEPPCPSASDDTRVPLLTPRPKAALLLPCKAQKGT